MSRSGGVYQCVVPQIFSLEERLAPSVVPPIRADFMSILARRLRALELPDTQKRVVLSSGVECRAALRKDLASDFRTAVCARDRDAAVRGNPSKRPRIHGSLFVDLESFQDRPGLAWCLGEATVILVKPFRIFWQFAMFPKDMLSGENVRDNSALLAEGERHTICGVRRKITPRLPGIRFAYKLVSTPGMDEYHLQMRFQGVRLEDDETPPHVVLVDYASVRDRPGLAAAELGRLAALGAILWCPSGRRLPDLRVRRAKFGWPTIGLTRRMGSMECLPTLRRSMATWMVFSEYCRQEPSWPDWISRLVSCTGSRRSRVGASWAFAVQ